MFDHIKRDLKEFETKLKFKMNEVKYSYEYREMKNDLSNAGVKIKSAVTEDLKSATNHAYDIAKKFVKKKRLKTMIG